MQEQHHHSACMHLASTSLTQCFDIVHINYSQLQMKQQVQCINSLYHKTTSCKQLQTLITAQKTETTTAQI